MNSQRKYEHRLPRILAEAPDDDEPLTPEEIEMLDARIRLAETTPAIPRDEVGRLLREARDQADEA
jgi:hypothetical protein